MAVSTVLMSASYPLFRIVYCRIHLPSNAYQPGLRSSSLVYVVVVVK